MEHSPSPGSAPAKRLHDSLVPASGQAAWVPVSHPIYPSLPRRWAAGAMDFALVCITLPLVWYSVWPTQPDPDVPVDTTVGLLRFALLSVVLGAMYVVTMQCSPHGTTWGERTMGIRVARLDGRAMDLHTALLRYVGAVLNLLCLLVPSVSCLASARHQAWHERLTGTVVVDHRSTHSHIRVYQRRIQSLDVAFLVLAILAVTTFVRMQLWPWLATIEERTRIEQVLQAVRPALDELHHIALNDGEFPQPLAKWPSQTIYAGSQARADYVGEGRIEIQFGFEPVRGRRVVMQAAPQWDSFPRCAKHDLPDELAPRNCGGAGAVAGTQAAGEMPLAVGQ